MEASLKETLAWAHEADIVIRGEDGIAKPQKNRFGAGRQPFQVY